MRSVGVDRQNRIRRSGERPTSLVLSIAADQPKQLKHPRLIDRDGVGGKAMGVLDSCCEQNQRDGGRLGSCCGSVPLSSE